MVSDSDGGDDVDYAYNVSRRDMSIIGMFTIYKKTCPDLKCLYL